MKKFISIIALLAMMIVGISAYYDNDTLVVGDKAPELAVANGYGTFDLNDADGNYVLLTFWSSADATSRIDCSAYSHWAALNAGKSVTHIALNFDDVHELFEELVRLDGLDSKAQYNVSGEEADLIRLRYGLLEGYGSLLIGPDGRIVAFNPSQSLLSSLV